jgi:ATP-dependent helicase/DNAse subunit B
MPRHRLITSGSLRLLETALLEHIQQEKRGDPFRPVVALCGSGFLGHYLSRELVRRGFPHLGVSLLTFNGLAETLARRVLLEKNLTLLPESGKHLVARRVVRSLPPQSYFARVQDQPHLPQVLATTFTDIEDSRLDFAAAVRQVPSKSAASLRKIGELAHLYEQYRAEFRERMLPEAGLLAEAGQQGSQFESLFGTGKLFVYGFYELTGAQYELLEQLVAQVEATAFLLFQSTSRFIAAERLRTWWQERAGEEVLSSQFSVLSENSQMQFWESERPSDLEILQGDVGEMRTEKRELRSLQDDGSVRVLSCPNEVSEAREIAREAVRLKREAGIPFREMAVLARDPATYLPLLAGVFTRAGIPHYIREGLPLSRVSAGRSLLAALSLPQANYARAEVMQWLTSGALDTRALTTAPAVPALSLWDRISAEAGIIAGAEQWRTRLQAQLARYGTNSPGNSANAGNQSPVQEYRREQTENLLRLMERLFVAGKDWQSQRTWTGLADAAAAFLRRFYPHNRERGQIEDTLFSLGHLDVFEKNTSLEEFVAAAEAALAERSCETGDLQQTGVHLLSLAAARHTRFRVVFIPGLVEGSFPALGRQDPILLDEERRVLSARSAGCLPLKSSRPQEENLLFLLALGAASERLVLTTARADTTSGTEKIASYFLLSALECLAGRPVSSGELNRPRAGVPRAVYVSPAAALLACNADNAIDTREFDLGKIKACLASEQPESSRYLEASASNFARALEAEQALVAAGNNLTVYEGLLATPECRQALSELSSRARVYSATALERYASCPYHYFLNDVLRLKELEDPNL